ncbi:MAG: beta-galactosidase, partial [Cellulomonadaceae bacterium]|nr:beta-galactosidase [Cellulomonadaceae bacterium]
MGLILATPTASPPPWFSLAHPDALPVEADGTRKWHGSRDTYCVAAPAYREASRRIAAELAARSGDHAGLQAWPVHTEYGTLCWCDHVAVAFRTWLRRRYVTLDALNDAWGTAFWSQGYGSWDEVLPPRATQYRHNPTHAVDFRRFSSDEMLAAFDEQRAEIRAAGSAAPVTTNLMLPTWNHLEQWSWAAAQDVVSIDHYLDSAGLEGEAFVAYASDLARSWAGRGPWLLMEQWPNHIDLGGRRVIKEEGRFTRNSLGYVARGSQGALFFQWRAPLSGAEAWNGGLVTHTGADTPLFDEARRLGDVLERIGEVATPPVSGPVVEADVAILWHADGWWALEHQHLPSDRLDYSASIRATHRALWHQGVATDFAAPGGPLDGYRLVLVPAMFPLADDAVAELERFVAAGGVLAVWYLSGVSGPDLHIVEGGYPGRLRALLGVRVTEVHTLDDDATVTLTDGSVADLWAEEVELTGATAVAHYATGHLAGRPAITRSEHGAGSAYYVSTRLDADSLAGLLGRLRHEAGVE